MGEVGGSSWEQATFGIAEVDCKPFQKRVKIITLQKKSPSTLYNYMEIKMSIKLTTAFSALVLAMAIPSISTAANVMTIQVYNNLYNQAATGGVAGMTPSNITVNYFNGATQCDTASVPFRTFVSEIVGTGSNQKCAAVTSVKIVAGTSSINTGLQVYSTTPVTVSLTAADYEHSIIVQDLGTGVTGTPASDGSIAPVFDITNGTLTTQGTLGSAILESKIR